ncbi:hypothetical protein ABZY57_04420 [Streptomyces sp. NPDC006450]|uniref:hypothetical protein n=1 Tax=Streptomyces sp. NPDC006450 TaxID=3155458 RepID=UPI0033B1084E
MRVTTLAAVAALAGAAVLGSGTAAAADSGPFDNSPAVVPIVDVLAAAADGAPIGFSPADGPIVGALTPSAINCVAPWKQWGFGFQDTYAACNTTAPVGDR